MFLALKWLTNLNALLRPYGIDAADVRADALARICDLSPHNAVLSLVSALRNGEPVLDDDGKHSTPTKSSPHERLRDASPSLAGPERLNDSCIRVSSSARTAAKVYTLGVYHGPCPV
jgi:hypothetical protein